MRSAKWLCALAWVLRLMFVIYVTIKSPEKTYFSGVDITADVNHRLVTVYVWIAAGLAVTAAGLPLRRAWDWTTITSSLIYFVVWYRSSSMRLVGVVEGYKLIWETAVRFEGYTTFTIRDLIIPLMMLIALLGALFHLLRRFTRRGGEDSNWASRTGA